MRNPAAFVTPDDFNEFSSLLWAQLQLGLEVSVKIRDGRIVPVTWYTEEGPECEGFVCYDGDLCLRWNNDGTSVTSSRFDMIETV